MNYWLLAIPILTALSGWITVFVLSKLFVRSIPGVQRQLSKAVGIFAAHEFANFPLTSIVEDPRNFDKIKPLVEAHVEEFLRKKLPAEMPMIGMFIGDKTIDTLKTIFIREVESLFPQVMSQFAGNLAEKTNVAELVATRVAAVDPARIQTALSAALQKQLTRASIIGLLIGLLIGLVQLGILMAIL
jgi:uncharacterized membrane protein YheB (UPF0754 family)